MMKIISTDATQGMQEETMYLTILTRHGRVVELKAFRNFGLAEFHAEFLLSKYFPYASLPDWEEGTHSYFLEDGFTLAVAPCEPPEQMDVRFQCIKYGVNLT